MKDRRAAQPIGTGLQAVRLRAPVATPASPPQGDGRWRGADCLQMLDGNHHSIL